MTDKPTITSTPPEVEETRPWRVEGGADGADERGLDDTVVRLDPIPANGAPAPVTPRPVHVPGPDYQVDEQSSRPSIIVKPVAEPKGKKAIRRTRKARLRIARLDPWSVMKTTFLFSIAFGIMFWVATYLLWSIVESSGLFNAVNELVIDLIANPNDTTPWRIEDYISTNRVLGVSALIAVINVVIITALGTIFAFLYNLSANVLGGLEVTLAED